MKLKSTLIGLKETVEKNAMIDSKSEMPHAVAFYEDGVNISNDPNKKVMVEVIGLVRVNYDINEKCFNLNTYEKELGSDQILSHKLYQFKALHEVDLKSLESLRYYIDFDAVESNTPEEVILKTVPQLKEHLNKNDIEKTKIEFKRAIFKLNLDYDFDTVTNGIILPTLNKAIKSSNTLTLEEYKSGEYEGSLEIEKLFWSLAKEYPELNGFSELCYLKEINEFYVL